MVLHQQRHVQLLFFISVMHLNIWGRMSWLLEMALRRIHIENFGMMMRWMNDGRYHNGCYVVLLAYHK